MTFYSRELRNMVYFEVYRFNPSVYGRRKCVVCEGMVLSSFRPIEVLIPYDIHSILRRAVVKKYIALKTTSNKRVTIPGTEKIASIYDRKRLKQLTGKEATIPERISMRIRTLQRASDRMLFAYWNELPSYIYSSEALILLALYYVRSRLGMKMFRFEDLEHVKKFVKKVHYLDGVLINHNDVYVYVPRPVNHVHYNDIRRAFLSLRIEQHEQLSEEEYGEEQYDEEEEYDEELPI
ncbi:MAG: hypothetical protein J7M38_15225 [Armatimonadetes bacterium]|nr:hypothetical protein [Armatimonadota bacterium]